MIEFWTLLMSARVWRTPFSTSPSLCRYSCATVLSSCVIGRFASALGCVVTSTVTELQLGPLDSVRLSLSRGASSGDVRDPDVDELTVVVYCSRKSKPGLSSGYWKRRRHDAKYTVWPTKESRMMSKTGIFERTRINQQRRNVERTLDIP